MLSKTQLSQIFQEQKLCVHLLGKGSNIMTELFNTFKVMKFPDMIRLELCKFGTRVARKQIPKPIQLLMELRGGIKKHKYNTRKKEVPNVQKHKSPKFNTSFIHRGIIEYNALSRELTKMDKMPLFVKNLKREIIHAYQVQT